MYLNSSIPPAIAAQEKKDYALNAGSAKFRNGRMLAVRPEKEFSVFSIHLLQK